MKQTNEILEALKTLGVQRGTRRHIDMLGRIVIPKDIRTQLNWNVGDALDIRLYDGAIVIVKASDPYGN